MKSIWVCFTSILLFGSQFACHNDETLDQKDYRILKDAYFSGHLTVVRSILEGKFKEKGLDPKETILYLKSLFYLKDWKEFFLVWKESKIQSPEMVLLYFKAMLLVKQDETVKETELTQLMDLVMVSPEAILLYLRVKKHKINTNEKKLFLAQVKGFRNTLDVLEKELEK
ncbi:hypothetical protein [Leptospira jelokensis]|uniref:Lipoprotein n=1 Tax=Leptospira jelokensis TaxID=2484931 RepID=A0A4Z0ZTT2_9LEPT|nr:hypothetical protein [Leptospira jelokensis]TGL69843.1 hypothetical protein EHQ62_07560 [Leptospira jelokensis]